MTISILGRRGVFRVKGAVFATAIAAVVAVLPDPAAAHFSPRSCERLERVVTIRLNRIDRFLAGVPEGTRLYQRMLWRKHRLQWMYWSLTRGPYARWYCRHWNDDDRPGTSDDDA